MQALCILLGQVDSWLPFSVRQGLALNSSSEVHLLRGLG